MFRRVLGHIRRQRVAFVALFWMSRSAAAMFAGRPFDGAQGGRRVSNCGGSVTRRVLLLSVVSAASGGLAVPGRAAARGAGHAPIVIQHDGDFTSASASAGCRCVVSGAGTTSSPYVIGPWSINNVAGTGVVVDGTSLTKSFVLSNLTVAGNGAQTSGGVVLQNINPAGTQSITAAVKGSATSIQTTGVGVTVRGSNYVTLDGGGANPRGPGIAATGAGTINKNSDGAIDVEQLELRHCAGLAAQRQRR